MIVSRKQIVLVGAPVDDGAGQKGCLMGPDAIRTAGLLEQLEALGHVVADHGNLTPSKAFEVASPNPVLKNFRSYAGWTRALHAKSWELGLQSVLPIYLGGDHAMAAGTVSGQARAAAELDRPLFVLWLDAHSDFHTLDSTDSGNLHGTPLAFACGLPGFDELLGAPLEHTVCPGNVEILGVRSIDAAEREMLLSHGVGVSDMRRVDEDGIASSLKPFLDRVRAANGLLHVSLDVDFLDPEIAPAVGTTVPGGATFREAHLVMEMLHDSGLVTSLDLVELNPFLDDRGKTARLMVDLTGSLFGRRVFDRPTRSF
ncbi:MAG: arginase [Roseibium album]|uniref:Arginase n=1 Tax=Roseibium album TaxID=311410 RepID=A0A0M6ZBE9_9HYPH|nr:arginase [Roseibium album]MBG6163206.1 arginase [Labrenzia sp. EL_195]MBG6174399.1 arginase [Labrenzia sp. EL_132]MBG6209084.1 arginase [Labrenzia sp. EL_126]MBG6229319.1 arginase [Labrenzia sp. EL_208]CTQ58703.1 Arginase [Roseibium album]